MFKSLIFGTIILIPGCVTPPQHVAHPVKFIQAVDYRMLPGYAPPYPPYTLPPRVPSEPPLQEQQDFASESWLPTLCHRTISQ